jgi:hypothetical protein
VTYVEVNLALVNRNSNWIGERQEVEETVVHILFDMSIAM